MNSTQEIIVKSASKIVFWICLTIIVLRYFDTAKNAAYDPVKGAIDQTAKSFNSVMYGGAPSDPLAEQIKAIGRSFDGSFESEKRKELIQQLIDKHTWAASTAATAAQAATPPRLQHECSWKRQRSLNFNQPPRLLAPINLQPNPLQ